MYTPTALLQGGCFREEATESTLDDIDNAERMLNTEKTDAFVCVDVNVVDVASVVRDAMPLCHNDEPHISVRARISTGFWCGCFVLWCTRERTRARMCTWTRTSTLT